MKDKEKKVLKILQKVQREFSYFIEQLKHDLTITNKAIVDNSIDCTIILK